MRQRKTHDHNADKIERHTQYEYSGIQELINSEVLRNYNAHIVDHAIKAAKSLKTVIDFGAGIGTLSNIFRSKYKIEVTCIEIDKQNQSFLQSRGFKYSSCINYIDGQVTFIFSSNVLEHIPDDIPVLRNMRDKLTDDGKIFLYLPGKMVLWSDMDVAVGHYRRYELDELQQKCKRVGLKIEKIHYADCIGFFASLLMKRLGYNSRNGIGSLRTLKFYDKYIFPISQILDAIGFKFLFGKNILLVATKNNDEG